MTSVTSVASQRRRPLPCKLHQARRPTSSRCVPYRGLPGRRVSLHHRDPGRIPGLGTVDVKRRRNRFAPRAHAHARPQKSGRDRRRAAHCLHQRNALLSAMGMISHAEHGILPPCLMVPSLLEEHACKIETTRPQIVVLIDRGQRAAGRIERMLERIRHQRDRKAERLHRRFELARHSAVVGRRARAGRQRSHELLRAARHAGEREERIRRAQQRHAGARATCVRVPPGVLTAASRRGHVSRAAGRRRNRRLPDGLSICRTRRKKAHMARASDVGSACGSRVAHAGQARNRCTTGAAQARCGQTLPPGAA
ncbi:Uncharacterised protein [Burkholderia pseudomallei]|nr:Uncharacterised protein [Burkholderia pseudomallei]CAJ4630013.1 Uncharacterised protein [Burkholderia pseudomallei]CAJ4963039.1 Uncharacterised protein [Burkholderia pseudomallei]CAJ5365364.1 Uncharacterised protein [Burkholderia pseudomallei]CAJ7263360.1 Uncharacterised protein [Burkholderia pseudomallei]